jgi:hypothetical protein
MLHRRCCVSLVIATMAGICHASLGATVLLPAEFREIVNGSEVIAFGRVVDTTAEESDGRTRVETLVTLRVDAYLKGGRGDTLVFKVPGGQVGRYRTIMVGAPAFTPGDEAVVFLTVRGADRPSVFGLNQGVFRVRVDAQTKRRLVVPPALLARTASPETVVRGSVSRRSVPLETFGAQVQAVMAEAARGVR